MRRFSLLLGPALLMAMLLVDPPGQLSLAAWRTAALLALMVIWWLAEPIPLAATALLPFAALPLLGVKTAEEAARSYASPLVALVLGGALLAVAAVKVGLHRQVAALAVRASGGDARRLVLTLMIATAVIGTLVAPGVLTIFMTEIALAVIAGSKVDTAQEQGRRFAVATIVGVAYAAAIGSLTTITANPVNAVAAGLLKSQTGRELTYLGWLQFGVPVLLIGVPLAWAAVTLVVFRFRLPTLDVASIAVALGDDRSLRVPRRRLLLIIAATVLAWVAMPLVRKVVPGASDGGLATLAALALFVTPSGGIGRTPMLDWEDARRVPWGVLVMVAGSLAIAAAVTETGLGAWLAAPLREIGGVPPGLALAALVVGVAVATELLSNFALVAIAVPAATALAGAVRIDPVPLVIGATMAAAGGYVVPGPPWLSVAASTSPARARDLARAGPLVLLLTASMISIVSWLLS